MGLRLDISDLGHVEQLNTESQTSTNLQASVSDRVDQLADIVNSEFAELKRYNQALEKSESEENDLLKKQKENWLEMVEPLRRSVALPKDDLADVRQSREHLANNTSVSILLDTMVKRHLN